LRTNLHQLDYIINVNKFQTIQDDIAKATDMAVITIDYKGHPITKHSQCSAFCNSVRKNPELSINCEKCDSRGGLEAARNQEAYIYLCHLGIVDFAIPIIVDGQYLGALMAGQVRLEKEVNNERLEHIVSKKNQEDYKDYPELKELYDQLFVMPIEKIEAIAQMMYHLINYIVGEAVLKTSLYEVNLLLTEKTKEHYIRSEDLQHNIHHYYPLYEIDEIDEIDEKAEIDKTDKKLKENEMREILKEAQKYSLLNPAFKYIKENYEKKIYLEDMSSLCNISSSYFSKIFKRETGFNFSNFVNKTKVAVAKELQESTSEPILNISLDLRFDDCGYFTKVFKKYFGETPASYRTQFLK
jgi:ligand-binding sensor protein/AraC-like DNA-binding protein